MDYFTNLNIRKFIGGILVVAGLMLINRMGVSGNANAAVSYAIGGIMIGGIGFVVIYLDIAKDKINGGHDSLSTLTHAYKQKEAEKRKLSGWNMNHGSNEDNSDNS